MSAAAAFGATHLPRPRRLFPAAACLALALAVPVAQAAAQTGTETGFPALRQLAATRATEVSALAMDLSRQQSLWQVAPGKTLTPASLSKLYVTAAALRRWGPGKRFTTQILPAGRLYHGTVHGNLVLLGNGAPALSDMQLWQLAQRVRQAGVRRVTGQLVVNESKFGPMACSLLDRCKAQSVSQHAYAAPLSAAAVNYNTWCLAVHPAAQSGELARVTHCDVSLGAPPVRGRIRTGPAGSVSHIAVTRELRRGDEYFRVHGSIAAGDPVAYVYRAVTEPGEHTALLLRQALRAAGIRVRGGDRVSYGPPPHAMPLASMKSRTLRLLLPRMLAYSNNFMADTLTLDLAAASGMVPPLDLGKAAAVMARDAAGRIPASTGTVGDPPPELLSGSGLSVGSRLSAANLISLLSEMYRRTALFPSFLGALTVPLYSPFSFLNQSQGLWSTHTAIKTGSLHDPVGVLGVAGYVRLHNGDWGAVAIILNGTNRHPGLNVNDCMAAIQHDINLLLNRSLR